MEVQYTKSASVPLERKDSLFNNECPSREETSLITRRVQYKLELGVETKYINLCVYLLKPQWHNPGSNTNDMCI